MSVRLLVMGDDRRHTEAVVRACGHELVRRDPELVLCHGGDGTLLRAERQHPGVPKLVCRQERPGMVFCPEHRLEAMLERQRAGELAEELLETLELSLGSAKRRALNDIVLRNDDPGTALRFELAVDGEQAEEHAGDGIVVATPFGSTGYYRSITRASFDSGIGLAFNNCTRGELSRVLPLDARIELRVVRGPAALAWDNDPRQVLLREGHRVSVQRSALPARVLGLEALACQRCRRADGRAFNPH